MTLIVEDGTGLVTAEAYVGLSDAKAYATRFGLVWPSDDTLGEQSLRRATRYIDATYRDRFIGYRAYGRVQALEWPRLAAYIRMGDLRPTVLLPSDVVPSEVIAATVEAASREAASPGALLPDPASGGSIKSEQVGPLTVEYFEDTGRSAALSGFPILDSILAALLGGANASSKFLLRA